MYAAAHTRLGPEAAIKVLPDTFDSDVERLVRFTREATGACVAEPPGYSRVYGVQDRALAWEWSCTLGFRNVQQPARPPLYGRDGKRQARIRERNDEGAAKFMKPRSGTVLVVLCASAFAQQNYPFRDHRRPVQQRIDNLLSLMTLEEKIVGLGNRGVVVPRLGIEGMPIGEALSGVVLGGPMQALANAAPVGPGGRRSPTPTTQFPQPTGLAYTWNRKLVRDAGGVIGREARYIWENRTNPRAYLVLLAPNADLARDPRWGRSQETFGEDPFLNGSLAASFVQGLQKQERNYWQAAAVVKHFLANSNEDGRYSSNSEFDERLMREYYSVPFRMAFLHGGARSFMAAFNAWNGVPMTVHPILRDVAVREWHVDSLITTDAGALGLLVTQHKQYPDLTAAAAAAVKAGVNMVLPIRDDYIGAVRRALSDNLLTEADLNAVLQGSLRTTIRLGLLDPPELVPFSKLKAASDPVRSHAHMSIAGQVARQAVVLLKNSSDLLPLDGRTLKSIAVVGARADEVLPDFYNGQPPYSVTPLAAIKAKLGSHVAVAYASDNQNEAAVKAAERADVAIVVVGNHPTCGRSPGEMLKSLIVSDGTHCDLASEGMESSDRRSLALEQEDLVKAVYAVNRRTVVVLVSSAPYAINWTQENVPAILHTTHSGQEEGNAIADVLFGDYNPAGRLVHTWVKSVDDLPPMMDYNIRNGRTYMYFKSTPLYPFGFGLSYTTFEYSNLRVSPGKLSVDVRNTGRRDGDEVVQFYASYSGSKVERPAKQLVGFDRVSIPRGATKTVTVPFDMETVAYWDRAQGRMMVEPGPVRIIAGPSAADSQLERLMAIK